MSANLSQPQCVKGLNPMDTILVHKKIIYIYIIDVSKSPCWLSNTAEDYPTGRQVSVWLYLGDGNIQKYCKTSNISHTWVGNKIVDDSDVVGASPVGAAATTSSFMT